MQSRRVAVVVTIVLVFALAVVAIAPAFAAPAPPALPMHAQLVASSPADASTVETATQVTLEFSEVINPGFVAVKVEGPGGSEADGAPVVEGREVTQALPALVAAGQHTVTYRVVSADGHPISGTLTFTTTANASSASSGPASAGATAAASTAPSGTTGGSATGQPTPTQAAAASTGTTDSGNGSWLAVALGGALLAALAVGAWRLPATGRIPARAGLSASDPEPGSTSHDEPRG